MFNDNSKFQTDKFLLTHKIKSNLSRLKFFFNNFQLFVFCYEVQK
jgi:hypothetical protein